MESKWPDIGTTVPFLTRRVPVHSDPHVFGVHTEGEEHMLRDVLVARLALVTLLVTLAIAVQPAENVELAPHANHGVQLTASVEKNDTRSVPEATALKTVASPYEVPMSRPVTC
jgi:hypothetical protein